MAWHYTEKLLHRSNVVWLNDNEINGPQFITAEHENDSGSVHDIKSHFHFIIMKHLFSTAALIVSQRTNGYKFAK